MEKVDIVFSDVQLRALARAASREGMSVEEFVRHLLRNAMRRE